MPPYLRIDDSTTDPEDHETHYVTAVKGNDLAKEQVSSSLLKKFGETLTGGALTWYSQLPARSIETFEEMGDKFVTAYVGAKKAQARVNDIFAIKQSLGEGLRDFLARFNRVRMTLPNMSEGMAVAAFHTGLSRDGSRETRKLFRLMKYPLITWTEIHNAYCAEVRADEDDLNGPTHRLTSVQAESRNDSPSGRAPSLSSHLTLAIHQMGNEHRGPSPSWEHSSKYVNKKLSPLYGETSYAGSAFPKRSTATTDPSSRERKLSSSLKYGTSKEYSRHHITPRAAGKQSPLTSQY
ncbi:PREDICTED: uncharacterized protein LOC109235490 [Nicotiana attenuata]|uniref:uncharacterized protein LOC109235490 n=1 Tax=Nicotiana attenuata TaxID=49451 RepID=UPI00090527A8|nr:PREDICTED: uncharacterized protein LOC109235490 [Nicotiana attenuata]